MNDFLKLVLPLVAVATTSVIGFFLSDHIGQLRREPTVVYALVETEGGIALTLSNVSNRRIAGAIVTLTCEASASTCFRRSPSGFHRLISDGPVAAKEVTERQGHGAGQIDLELVLMPDARLRIVANKEPNLALPISFEFDSPADAPVRLVEAQGVTGYVVRNYLRVLVWAFLGALGVLASLVVIGLIGLLYMVWSRFFPRQQFVRPAPLPPNVKMEIEDDSLVLQIGLRSIGATRGGRVGPAGKG